MARGPQIQSAHGNRRAADDSASAFEATAESGHLPEPLPVTDSWPDIIPVSQAEVVAVEIHLGRLIDEIIKDCHDNGPKQTERASVSSVSVSPS
jgi:hypothetical protein